MNRIFKKLTIRTILANIKQFLSVILIVFLSSMLLSGFITNYVMFNGAITTYFDNTNLADIWFYVDGISEDDEQFFVNSNIDYDKRLYLETSAEISGGIASNQAKIYIYDGKISNPYKESGQWGCVIDKNVYASKNLKIGTDKINFSVEFEYFGQAIELNLSFLITGTMSLDECADSYSTWPVFITEEKFLEKLSETLNITLQLSDWVQITDMTYNQILVKTDNINETISKVENYYNNFSENNLLYSFDKNSVESVVLLNSEINQAKKMIYVFPVIFLIVSVLVILTTINQLVLQEKQKIGTLKSIGIPDKKILRYYSKFGAILCAIGSILGVLFGVIVIPSIMFIKYKLVYSIPNDYINLTVPLWMILLVILGFILLGYFVSSLACYNILHKRPIECMKFDANSSRIKGIGKLKKLPFSIKMAVRNIRLKPIRTIMATIGIAGCVALLLCGFGIGDTLSYSVTYDFGNNFYYDITTTYTKDDFEQNLNSLNGLGTYEKFEKMLVSAKSDNLIKNVNLYKLKEMSNLSNIYLYSGDLAISKSLADDFNLEIGDVIIITLGSQTRELEITKVIETSVMNGFFVCDELGFDDAYKSFGMWIECENVTDEKIDFINSINGTNSATSMQKFIDNIESKLSSINVMTTTLKIFAVSLDVIVLFNFIVLILKERVREIATLKVLGKGLFGIVLTLFFEILFMSLLGSIVGMFFGYPLLVLVLSINKVEIMNFLFHINFVSYLLSIVIVLFTIIFVMFFCYKKAKDINMIESLKSVE